MFDCQQSGVFTRLGKNSRLGYIPWSGYEFITRTPDRDVGSGIGIFCRERSPIGLDIIEIKEGLFSLLLNKGGTKHMKGPLVIKNKQFLTKKGLPASCNKAVSVLARFFTSKIQGLIVFQTILLIHTLYCSTYLLIKCRKCANVSIFAPGRFYWSSTPDTSRSGVHLPIWCWNCIPISVYSPIGSFFPIG